MNKNLSLAIEKAVEKIDPSNNVQQNMTYLNCNLYAVLSSGRRARMFNWSDCL